MNNLPERIYLNEDANTAFNGIAYQIEPTYLLNKSVEYIRKDVAEEMAKELAIQLSYRFKHTCGKSPEQIVDEFLNSKSK